MFNPFKKNNSEPSTEDEVDSEDLKRTEFIQQKSRIGVMFAELQFDPNEDQNEQYRHYENVRDEMIGELDLIEDEFYRGFATHQIIEMCFAANEDAICRALLASVRDEFIREQIFESFPELRSRILGNNSPE